MLSHTGPDKNHVNLMHWFIGRHVSASKYVDCTADYVKNDVSLCKLDVNVKNQMTVAASVGFFKLQRKKRYFLASSSLKIKCG